MANPLKSKFLKTRERMQSLHFQASPGAVEVPTRDFVEIYELIVSADQAMDDMSKTIDNLNTKKK